jgi:hypothetical protein
MYLTVVIVACCPMSCFALHKRRRRNGILSHCSFTLTVCSYDDYSSLLALSLSVLFISDTTCACMFVHFTYIFTLCDRCVGIGTRGFQLVKDRRGNQRWSSFWSYGFLDDYKLPGDRRRLFESYMPSSVPFEELLALTSSSRGVAGFL